MNYSVTTTVTTEAYFEIVDQELYDNEQEKRAKREENKKKKSTKTKRKKLKKSYCGNGKTWIENRNG